MLKQKHLGNEARSTWICEFAHNEHSYAHMSVSCHMATRAISQYHASTQDTLAKPATHTDHCAARQKLLPCHPHGCSILGLQIGNMKYGKFEVASHTGTNQLQGHPRPHTVFFAPALRWSFTPHTASVALVHKMSLITWVA